MKSLDPIIRALSLLGNFACRSCHRNLINDDEKGTVIKKHVLITDKKRGSIEIDCRYCGHKNIIANGN